ncbi:AraC family transcriptional regulator [Leeia sp. TBRC 13508]|uniref:AraC family transcriptional regulator n=1 Tax=Leeia speluncae TaxID=2884804 RepID=A0ABS8D386_9NEIS|nr:AraC family transcriptional regulator [Leeia speluncae]MCB6182655.1 AraC family transcriptional regulator [Leeia speluncae]
MTAKLLTPSEHNFRQSAALPFVDIRVTRDSAACFQKHTHDEFSFGVIDSGRAAYTSQGQHYAIGQGMTVLINPGSVHACNPAKGEYWSYRMLFVDTGWIGDLQSETPGFGSLDYTPFAFNLLGDAKTKSSFDQLYQQLNIADPLGAEEALISFLLNHGFPNVHAQALIRDDRAVRMARELIQDCLCETFSLEEIAKQVGMSRYHLIRRFQQIYGQTPHAYQLDQRILSARQQLKRGAKLSELANQLGFADQSHFQRVFKQRLAVTPRQYQQAFLNH